MSKTKETLRIVKIGGAVIDNSEMLNLFLQAFSRLEGLKVLVHGGGRIATEIGLKMGIESKMVEGRRVTDAHTIDLVTMVYGGLVNKQLVAKLQPLGVNAIGLTGADGNLILATKRPPKNGVDYGLVGDPVQINATFLSDLLQAGSIPIIAPLTHDGKGQIFNTNADTMAGALAAALAPLYEVELLLTFELDGVLREVSDPDSLISTFPKSLFQSMKEQGTIHSGMIPKLENAFHALEQGAKTARICKFSAITTTNGTFLQV